MIMVRVRMTVTGGDFNRKQIMVIMSVVKSAVMRMSVTACVRMSVVRK